MNRIYLFLFAFMLHGCGNRPSDTKNENPLEQETVHSAAKPTGFVTEKPFVLAGCYEMTMKTDSAFLDLNVKDTIVTGKLSYNWQGKDQNTGTINGVIRDSLIIAEYTFQSEGLTSVREEIFKIEDSTLVLAFGDLKEENKKYVYADRNHLQFHSTSPFFKVPCKQN